MDDGEVNECYFPGCEVHRIGNCVMLACKNEDDAVVVFELFREMVSGNPITFRTVGS